MSAPRKSQRPVGAGRQGIANYKRTPTMPNRLPYRQWARPRLKAAIVALGVRGLLTPATALALLARWHLTHE